MRRLQVLACDAYNQAGKVSRETINQSLLFMSFSIRRSIPTDINTCAALLSFRSQSSQRLTRIA